MSDSTQSKPPRRSVAWWKLLVGVIAAVIVLILGVVLSGPIRSGASALLADGDHQHEDEGWWTCGMHPWVVLPSPDGGCPICGMDLVPLDPAKFAGELTIDPAVVQNIGVRIGEATRGPLVQTIRTVGNVEVDETRLADVNTRFSGFIEETFVDETGQRVEAGEPLFSVYSPELYAAADEYQLALKNAEGGGNVQRDVLVAAERRLQLLGLTDDEIARISDDGGETVTLRSPASGVVLEKMAVDGMRIEPGMRMYRIADLTNLYVQTAVYEDDLPLVEVGMPATVTLTNMPGESFDGEVTFVSPTIDPKTRQGRVRVEVPNEDGQLKPGMFASVTLTSRSTQEVTLVPREAVIDTGRRQLVMVSLGEGRFDPREVETGRDATGGMVEIRSGVDAGEKVVTSGQFLLDSEARTREALAKMLVGDEMAVNQQADVAMATVDADELSAEEAEALNALLRAYLPMSDALSRDTAAGFDALATDVAEAARSMNASDIANAAEAVVSAGDLDATRSAFARLSTLVSDRVMRTGVPATLDIEVARLRCPMFPPGEKSPWLQAAGEPRNPYYGSAMLACFDERAIVPATPVAGAESSSTSQPAAASTDASREPMAAMPASMARPLADLLRAYLVAADALADDRTTNLDVAAKSMTDAARRLAPEAPTLDVDGIATAAEQLATDDLSDARLAFKAVSDVLCPLVADVGVPASLDTDLIAARCPMFPMGEASWWIQPAGGLRNPYYGSAMLTCSDEQLDLPRVPVMEGATE